MGMKSSKGTTQHKRLKEGALSIYLERAAGTPKEKKQNLVEEKRDRRAANPRRKKVHDKEKRRRGEL